MKKPEYKDGPWNYSADTQRVYVDVPFAQVPVAVVSTGTIDCSYPWDQILATGALLRAAPDLAEALHNLVEEHCDYMRINHLGDPLQQHNIKFARAALLKAGYSEE